MGIVILVLLVAAGLGAVVWIGKRSDERKASFWPSSSAGQIGAVILGLFVVAMLVSLFG